MSIEHFEDTVEYWTELRDWLAAIILKQSNPETVEELAGAVAACEHAIARLAGNAD
jgi:hypothetical protein